MKGTALIGREGVCDFLKQKHTAGSLASNEGGNTYDREEAAPFSFIYLGYYNIYACSSGLEQLLHIPSFARRLASLIPM